ncbi:MAG TPA: hypothetical protein VFF65_01080 [Phycisphaerales bacterium]|nr:hypothetical protein [Phycisphaerales bacterium]
MIERPVTLSEDARALLTSAATGAARTNRPRWLIYLGAAAVLIAACYTGYNLTRRVAAEADLASRQSRHAEVKAEVDRINAIKAADEALGGGDRSAPDSRMADKITKIATDLGLAVGNVTEGDDQRANPSKTVKRKRYDFRFNNQPADPIFTWLKRVTAELGGVQINRIELSPGDGTDGRPGWNLSVTFTRWERVS